MVQAISLVAMAAEQAQQSQPAQPAQPADPAAESLGSNGGTVAVSEAQVAASRFEQAVVAQGVSIAPGILPPSAWGCFGPYLVYWWHNC